MRIVSAIVLLVMLPAGGALAQSASPPAQDPAKLPPPPRPIGADAGILREPPMMPGGMRRIPMPPMMMSKAAHFRLRHADIGLDVKCADDEPMKACADIILQLLDKLQSSPRP